MDNWRLKNIKKLITISKITKKGEYVNNDGEKIKLGTRPKSEYIDFLHITLGDMIDYMHRNIKSTGHIKKSIVRVENNDSLGYAIKYYNTFKSTPLLLNFANPYTPGGGVRKGCIAQEEDLCRRTDLLYHIENDNQARKYYKINRREKAYSDLYLRGIITKDISVIVDSNGVLLKKPITVDVFTVAAPIQKTKEMNKTDIMGIDALCGAIIDTASFKGYTDIILGAFGCGAFGNDPKVVSKSFKYYLDKYSFNSVGFPIITKTKNDKGNLETFTDVFKC